MPDSVVVLQIVNPKGTSLQLVSAYVPVDTSTKITNYCHRQVQNYLAAYLTRYVVLRCLRISQGRMWIPKYDNRKMYGLSRIQIYPRHPLVSLQEQCSAAGQSSSETAFYISKIWNISQRYLFFWLDDWDKHASHLCTLTVTQICPAILNRSGSYLRVCRCPYSCIGLGLFL